MAFEKLKNFIAPVEEEDEGEEIQYVEEEAEELCEADGKDEVIWEAADLIYFVNVLLYKEGVSWKDVYDELDRRHKEK